MRRIILVGMLLLFFSCEKNETNDLLPTADVNVTVNLRLPQYFRLLTPGSSVYIPNVGVNGIWVINSVIGGYSSESSYKAFDAACPEYSCKDKMEFDKQFKLKCKCHNVEYSIYDGSPQDKKHTRFAREYRVRTIDKFNIVITN